MVNFGTTLVLLNTHHCAAATTLEFNGLMNDEEEKNSVSILYGIFCIEASVRNRAVYQLARRTYDRSGCLMIHTSSPTKTLVILLNSRKSRKETNATVPCAIVCCYTTVFTALTIRSWHACNLEATPTPNSSSSFCLVMCNLYSRFYILA